jgi:rubrerythrin
MNILEFAKQKEKFSIDLYTGLAERTKDEGLRGIFAMLTEEEEKHYEIICGIAKKAPVEVLQTPMLKHASSVFRKMKKGADHFIFPDSEIEVYKKARQYEEESRQFYLDSAREATEPQQKEVLIRLSSEEQKHFVLLDNICDFVEQPMSYLENAEFVNLENYVKEPF